MSFISAIEVADLHQETYATILDSLIEWGDKKDFAKKVGISPRFFRYLCDPYNDRHPSRDTAYAIANALPLPTTQKQSLVEHMLLAKDSQRKAHRILRSQLPDRPIEDFLSKLRELNEEATFGSDLEKSERRCRVLQKASSCLVRHLSIGRDPLALMEAALFANDMESILKRQVDALWHAKLARFTGQRANMKELSAKQRSEFIDLRINAARLEAVSYANLGASERAITVCEKTEQLLSREEFKHRADYWKPHLYRDKLKAIREKSRFAISTAESLADEVMRALESDIYLPKESELLSSLIHSSLVRTYVKHGSNRSLKKAKRLLKTKLTRAQDLDYAGPLHRTTLLKTWAQFYWQVGDRQAWRHFVLSALEVATAAGLEDQVQKINSNYGNLLNSKL